MAVEAGFDIAAAHRYFSAWCFNRAWDLMEKPDRTEDDGRRMVALSHASIFHWMSREDCTDKNLAVGYWQASRVQALVGNAREAMRFAQISLGYSADAGPFCEGYAYEALARAAWMMGNAEKLEEYLSRAEALAERVTEEEDRELLVADLRQLRRDG